MHFEVQRREFAAPFQSGITDRQAFGDVPRVPVDQGHTQPAEGEGTVRMPLPGGIDQKAFAQSAESHNHQVVTRCWGLPGWAAGSGFSSNKTRAPRS